METRGNRLKAAREKLKLNQVQLAKKLGVTKANVSKWEARDFPNIDLDVFFDFAEKADIDPRELATGKTPASKDLPNGARALVEAFYDLPQELQLPIRSLIETLYVAKRESYAKYVKQEVDRVKKRDSKKHPA